MSKQRVAILFGGRSTEHEVSVLSATTILGGLDPARYSAVLIGIDHDGLWYVAEPESELLPEAVFSSPAAKKVVPAPGPGFELRALSDGSSALQAPIDVIFPIVHGRGGEDGVLQGVLESTRTPYVGAGVATAALCMDKTLSKRVLRDAGLAVLASVEISREQARNGGADLLDRILGELEFPVFIKPSNTGSSVGVSKARTREQLEAGIYEAARYDFDVLIEPGVDAREIECAVLGGRDACASVLGEILSYAEFYDYEAKYVSDETELVIPAELPARLEEEVTELALRAFRALKCWGMARVDFFIERGSERVFVNELNTLPGFTEGSMYPRLWDASGIALPELVDRLIELALERQREASALEIRFTR